MQLPGRENGELLVAAALGTKGDAHRPQPLPQRERAVRALLPETEIQTVGKEGVKLQPQKKPLGQQRAPLLVRGKEMLLRASEDHGLAKERAALCSADVKNVADLAEETQGHVRLRRGERIGKPRAVHKEPQRIFVADRADLPQRRGAVQSAVFRRVREIDRAGLHHVGTGLVGIEAAQIVPQRLRLDPAVLIRRDGQHLVPRGLHRPGLVHGDVSARGADHALPGAQDRGEDGRVRLGPADEKINVGVRIADRGADLLFCTRRDHVEPVGRVLAFVGRRERREDLRRAAAVVVTGKVDHVPSPP